MQKSKYSKKGPKENLPAKKGEKKGEAEKLDKSDAEYVMDKDELD